MKCSLNLAVNRGHLQGCHQELPCPQRVPMSLAVYVGLMWVRVF